MSLFASYPSLADRFIEYVSKIEITIFTAVMQEVKGKTETVLRVIDYTRGISLRQVLLVSLEH